MNFLHNQTALLPHSAGEWISAVEAMTVPTVRARIRNNAIELFRLRYTIEHATQQFLGIIRLYVGQTRPLRFTGLRRLMLRAYVNGDSILNVLEKRSR